MPSVSPYDCTLIKGSGPGRVREEGWNVRCKPDQSKRQGSEGEWGLGMVNLLDIGGFRRVNTSLKA